MKTIMNLCTIWDVFGYKLAHGQRSSGSSLGARIVLQLFLGATSRGFPDSERYTESFEKKIHEQNQIF